MFVQESSAAVMQRVICLFVSAAIVTVCMTFGAYAVARATDPGYSVTVTQLA